MRRVILQYADSQTERQNLVVTYERKLRDLHEELFDAVEDIVMREEGLMDEDTLLDFQANLADDIMNRAINRFRHNELGV